MIKKLKGLTGMARVLVAYSKTKKLLEKGLDFDDISEIFDVDALKLEHFMEICDLLIDGEVSLSVDLGFLNKVSNAII